MLGAKSGKNQVSCKTNPSTNPVKFNNYVSKDVNNINIGQEWVFLNHVSKEHLDVPHFYFDSYLRWVGPFLLWDDLRRLFVVHA